MKNFSAIEYICIDIANNVGQQGSMRGDKDLFENRIQWVKDNVDNLESFTNVAENKYRYMRAVMALREVMQGLPTGHTVGLDAICSGISIMSAITGCLKGCKATGLIDTGERPDAYTKVTQEMNKVLASQGLSTSVSRGEAKQAVN